jgi:hypothetical protein
LRSFLEKEKLNGTNFIDWCKRPALRHLHSPLLVQARRCPPLRVAILRLTGEAAVPPPFPMSLCYHTHSHPPPHPLLCITANLSSVFPRRSLPSHVCPSSTEASRQSHPCLRHLDVAGEDPSPCATSSPRRPSAGVTPSCRRPPLTSVQSRRRATGVARGRTPRVQERSALAVAWAAFQRRPRVCGPLVRCRQAGQPKWL